MKEKRNCKIIQDLLPNYIDNLTNEETNNFIEEHIKECDECKNILNNMKKELKINNIDGERKKVNYIKKYNNKLNLLRNILLLIVIISFIVVGRKIFILTSLSNKAQKLINAENYHLKVETYSLGTMTVVEEYCKDGKNLITLISYQEEGLIIDPEMDPEKLKLTFYSSEDEIIMLVEGENFKQYRIVDEFVPLEQISFISNNFFANLYTAITTSVEKIELNGKKSYMIREKNTEKFIDADTGLSIKMIDNSNNETIDYYYEYGVVQDSDVVKPDLTGYELKQD